jgi:uncharacterized protein
MLLTFSVSNFRSFLGEQTFSLVANNRLMAHAGHLVEVPGTDLKALRVGVLYGANASGKSNLIQAMEWMKKLALELNEGDAPPARQCFAGPGGAEAPTEFDLQILLDGKVLRYGLELTASGVQSEWLVEVRGNREVPYFERELGSDGRSTVTVGSEAKRLEGLAKLGVKRNQTFLATMKQLMEAEDLPESVRGFLDCMEERFLILTPESRFIGLADSFGRRKGLREFAGNFLREVSTGIERIELQRRPVSWEELASQVAEISAEQLRRKIETPKDWAAMVRLKSGEEVNIAGEAGGSPQMLTLQPVHELAGVPVAMDLRQESDGTRRLLDLMPALYGLAGDARVFVIDEIDRSMHPMLVRQYVQFFLEKCGSQSSQLIFTTHESSLLDFDLLRRDEIWFAEKDPQGASHLYSLMDFKERKDGDVRKHYLQGRFGAVPFVGGVERLAEGLGEGVKGA